jgi:hypothetical protein
MLKSSLLPITVLALILIFVLPFGAVAGTITFLKWAS